MISAERLRSLLSYDGNSGHFFWKSPAGMNTMTPGSRAGWHSGRKAWRIEVDGRNYLAHRLAWLYVYGEWPSAQIDHINGDRSDNRISNLRLADNSQNQANMGAKSNNGTGIRGVSRAKSGYVVQIYKTVGGVKKRAAGRFKTLTDAATFAQKKSAEFHGEFSAFGRSTP